MAADGEREIGNDNTSPGVGRQKKDVLGRILYFRGLRIGGWCTGL